MSPIQQMTNSVLEANYILPEANSSTLADVLRITPELPLRDIRMFVP
jgi:hypothetical protein